MKVPDFTTDATDSLCRDIAKRSKGVCFLGLSSGKDSLCAYLSLSRYFRRIIPFHCASWPGVDFVTKYLDYLEYEFQTKILRLMGEDFPMAFARGMYQPFEEIEASEAAYVEDYSKLDIVDYLRYMYSLPRAWCAFGISKNDSIDRLIYCRQYGGKSENNRTFYPCWDWPRKEIIRAITESGLKLRSDYRYSSRNLGGIPSTTVNRILREHYPQAYGRMLECYPTAEAKTVREMLLDVEWEVARDAAIRARGGKAASPVEDEDGEGDSDG